MFTYLLKFSPLCFLHFFSTFSPLADRDAHGRRSAKYNIYKSQSDEYVLIGNTPFTTPWQYRNQSARDHNHYFNTHPPSAVADADVINLNGRTHPFQRRPVPTWPTWTDQRDLARFQVITDKSLSCNCSLIAEASETFAMQRHYFRGGNADYWHAQLDDSDKTSAKW